MHDSQFSLLFAAGASLTFITRPWLQYDKRTGENIALVKDPGEKARTPKETRKDLDLLRANHSTRVYVKSK